MERVFRLMSTHTNVETQIGINNSMVTGKKQYKFNNIVATLLEGKEYMLGKGRSYVQQAGIKSSSDFENVQKSQSTIRIDL